MPVLHGGIGLRAMFYFSVFVRSNIPSCLTPFGNCYGLIIVPMMCRLALLHTFTGAFAGVVWRGIKLREGKEGRKGKDEREREKTNKKGGSTLSNGGMLISYIAD